MKYIWLLWFSLILVPGARSQTFRPLDIGDSVPNISLKLLNGNKVSEGHLYDFQEDLLLLDFWSIYCTSCIQHFPNLKKLEVQFTGKMKAVLINSEYKSEFPSIISSFLARRKQAGHPINLTVAVQDTTANQLFVHTLIPHYVWIHHRKVVAITNAEDATPALVKSILAGYKLTVSMKRDILDYDPQKPLFIDQNGGDWRQVRYYSWFCGYIDGFGTRESATLDSGKRFLKYTMINQTPLQLYQRAWNCWTTTNHILLPADCRDEFQPPEDARKKEHLFSYEIVTPGISKSSLLEKMRSDLANYFGYTARVQKRIHPCLVLRLDPARKWSAGPQPKDSSNLDETLGPLFFRNQPVKNLVGFLNTELPWPVLDESGYTGPVSVTLPGYFRDLATLERSLRQQGLLLTEEPREVELFVIEKAEVAPGR